MSKRPTPKRKTPVKKSHKKKAIASVEAAGKRIRSKAASLAVSPRPELPTTPIITTPDPGVERDSLSIFEPGFGGATYEHGRITGVTPDGLSDDFDEAKRISNIKLPALPTRILDSSSHVGWFRRFIRKIRNFEIL